MPFAPTMILKSSTRAINDTELKTMNIEGQSKKISVFVQTMGKANPTHTTYNTVKVDGVDLFYREAGPKDAPVLLLPHGFPTSSHMFRNLIPQLADKYHVIAPDYPGFGQSGMPDRSKFVYSFDNYAQVVDKLTRQLGVSRYTL